MPPKILLKTPYNPE